MGTYSGKGRYDSDDEIEDDYLMLAAYTRKMNLNWTKERSYLMNKLALKGGAGCVGAVIMPLECSSSISQSTGGC